MPRYTLNIFGLEISFKTDADNVRISAAQALLEERYDDLRKAGSTISREKLLTFLSLSLADDYLVEKARVKDMEARISELLAKQP